MPRTNALAYCEKVELTAVKSFLTLATGVNIIKLFTNFRDELECLLLARLSFVGKAKSLP